MAIDNQRISGKLKTRGGIVARPNQTAFLTCLARWRFEMSSSVMMVPEKRARKLAKELGFSDAAKATTKKLTNRLLDQINALNGESVEDMDITNSSKSLLEEMKEAIEDEKDIEIGDEIEEEEEDEEEEEAPRKTKSKKVKSKKTKSPKSKTSVTKKKKSKSSGKSSYNPEYQQKRREEDLAIEKLVRKGPPRSVASMATKLGLPERRVQCHVDNWKKNRKTDTKFYKTDKKGLVTLRVKD